MTSGRAITGRSDREDAPNRLIRLFLTEDVMNRPGYFSHPSICGDAVAFASDDDIWLADARGGTARRLTSSPGVSTRPAFSPDGSRIAYVGVEEGYPEIYVMDSSGGPGTRLTRLASQTILAGWTRDGGRVVYATLRDRSNRRLFFLYAVPADGGLPELLPVGPAVSASFGPGGATLICRGAGMDPAWWKRYRGGRLGEIWLDSGGTGEFRSLLTTGGNLASPVFADGRVFFLSDHEGVGNVYSCSMAGKNVRRHTSHGDFYARMLCSDGKRLAYCAGGEIWLLNPSSGGGPSRIEIDFPSQQSRTNRRFVPADKFLEDYELHPEGHSLCLTVRGKPVTLAHWEGAAVQYGVPGGSVRYRLARWLKDGRRLATVSDEGGTEAIEIYGPDGLRIKRLGQLDIGRPISLEASPARDELLLSNHRGELIWVDLASESMKILDRSSHGRIHGFDFSPDGRWAAYGFPKSFKTSAIMLCRIETGEKRLAAEPVLRDIQPSFDPDGKYLYFISYSCFDPVRDIMDFAYSFPRGVQLKLVTLRKDLLSPFVPQPKAPAGGPPGPAPEPKPAPPAGEGVPAADQAPKALEIDLDGIERRALTFPVQVGDYSKITGLPGGKVLFQSNPVQGLIGKSWLPSEPEAKASLMVFEFDKGREDLLIGGITDYAVDAKRRNMAVRSVFKLRVLPAGSKPADDAPGAPSRRNGWIDLNRVRVSVNPREEWRQMFAEGWRLLRDHYYIEDMGGCDWEKVFKRYSPLIDRISTRRELSDLFWEMGGELGTSHAYELGGDFPPMPRYPHGFLGADLAKRGGSWFINHIVQGDPGEQGLDSPLNAPGLDVREGDRIAAINGIPVSDSVSPDDLLVNQGGQEIALTIERGGEARTVTVRTIADEMPVRNSEWVRNNRNLVLERTGGRVGYVYISDLGPQGFAEFHRSFLTEVEREALIIDVRFNSGGHVSPLVLQRLCRRSSGYSINRWSDPSARPPDSFDGPMVCITNEYAGSDGDSFSHNWKQLGLGLLIGKRTWGGIVGLNPTHPLVDGTMTTQPEFFNWYNDIGYGLENHGAEPDIVVEITPQDYANGRDPQLDRAIAEITRELEKNPPRKPDFSGRPDRSLPSM